MYGSETWAAPSTVMERLDCTERKLLTWLLGYFWPRVCHDEDLYAEIDVVYRRMTRGKHQHLAPPSKVAKVNRLCFFGHILRRPADRLVQRVLRSSSGSSWKRPPGRKRKFWTEAVKEDLRTLGVARQFRRDARFRRIWNSDEWIDSVQALARHTSAKMRVIASGDDISPPIKSIRSSELFDFRNDPAFEPELIQTAAQAYEALTFSENIATKFWEKWNTEYLIILHEIHRYQMNQKRHVSKIPQIGEIVLFEQESMPRGQWVYGKIEQLVPSADGMRRSAKILMPSHKILQGPVNKVYPLEIRSEPDNQQLVERNSEIMVNGIHMPTAAQSRNHLARTSKSRALNVIREFEADLDRSVTLTSARSTVSCLITASLSFFLINPGDA
ncbi:hypothetical protein RB195_023357 [Necator americanus]